MVSNELATNVVARIASGSYDVHFKKQTGEIATALFRSTPGNIRWLRFWFQNHRDNQHSIVVEACTNLASSAWVSLQSGTLINGSRYFSDPQWVNYPNRFYRIRWP